MSRGRGTGSPMWFECPRWRHDRNAGYGTPGPRHEVKLTGRTRPNSSTSRGMRSADTVREYECISCGHVGWSNHIDLEHMEARTLRHHIEEYHRRPTGGTASLSVAALKAFHKEQHRHDRADHDHAGDLVGWSRYPAGWDTGAEMFPRDPADTPSG